MLNTKHIDMLHGALTPKIILFAIPLALMGGLEQLFNAADTAMLGTFVGVEAMAAVGANTPLIGILVSLFMGLSLGSNVIIARFIGAGRPELVGKAVQTSVVFSLITGFALMVIGEIFAKPMLIWLDVPNDVLAMAETYLRIYLLGLPVIGLYNFEAAIMRARGDTGTPLIVLAAASLLNAVFNYIFIMIGWEVAGVAAATVLANALSALLLLRSLMRSKDVIHLSTHHVKLSGLMLKDVLGIGFPAAIQGVVFSIANILIQAAINGLGPAAMAASAAAFVIEINVYAVVNAFAQATTTFVSQNYGAGQLARSFRVTKIGITLTVVVTLAVSCIVMYFADPLLRFFNTDAAVVSLGITRLWIVMLPEFTQGFIDVFSGALRGYGFSMPPAILTLVGVCGVRLSWLFLVFPQHSDFATLMICYPASWIITGLLMMLLYKHYRKYIKEIRI